MNKQKSPPVNGNVSILLKESSNGIVFDGTHIQTTRTVSCHFVFPERLPEEKPRIAQWTNLHPTWSGYWQANTKCSQPYDPLTGFPCQYTSGRTIRGNFLLPASETIFNDLIEANNKYPSESLALGLQESGSKKYDPNRAVLHLAFFYMKGDSLDNPRHSSMDIHLVDHCPSQHPCRQEGNNKVLAALLRSRDTVEKKNGLNDPILSPGT